MIRTVAILGITVFGCLHSDVEDHDISVDDVTVPTTVSTDRGPVRGVPDGDLVEFRGIPYAAAPTGSRRFAPPVLAPRWTATRDASHFGPACPQAGTIAQSEDCLTINVWAHASGPARPIIVWIHGGGFVAGTASSPEYDGAALARNVDVVVMSFDYRLGVLGFLALPQLAAPDTGTGNWGLRDQIAALQWVQRNAAAFGGDPKHVMIAGESAGGVSVCALLGSPLTQRDLYAAAAMQSGSCRPILNMTTPAGPPPPAPSASAFPSAVGLGILAAIHIGCTSGDIAACLRGKPSAVIMTAQAQLPTFMDLGVPIGATLPVVDGVVLDMRPYDAIAAGRGAVPLIVGSNKDDESVFVMDLGITNATGQFATYLSKLPSADAKAAPLYSPLSAFGGELGAAITFATDLAFACPAYQVALAHRAPTYLYELERGVPNGRNARYGAVHGLDYVDLFGSFAWWDITPTTDDIAVAATIEGAWGALAHGVAPPGWPAVSGTDPPFLAIASPRSVRTGWRGGRCLWLGGLGLLPQ